MDMRELPFSVLDERHYFADLLPVLFLLLMSLAFPSSLSFAPVGLSLPFLTFLFWHRFFSHFFSFVNEYDIEGELFVRGLPLFWDCVKNFKR